MTHKKVLKAVEEDRQEGERQQQAILEALRELPCQMIKDPKKYNRWMNNALKRLDFKVPISLRKAILNALTERDETAEPVQDKKGGYVPDTELRDCENVPLSEDVYACFDREVKPYVLDAWVDMTYQDERDGKVGVVGYEINFNCYFYKYIPPPHLEELVHQIAEKEREIAKLLEEWGYKIPLPTLD